MRIVYSILGTFNSGGMERVLANKANWFAKLGHEIIIITTDQKARKSYFDLDPAIQCIDLGINYTNDINKGVIAKVVSYFGKQHKHYSALERELAIIKADIVISLFDNDASFLHKIKDGSKKILEIHFSRFKRLQYGRKGLLGWIDSYRSKQDLDIVQQYDSFIVLTHEDKGYWGNLKNIHVIPNANSFVPSTRATLTNKKVIAIGRYDYQKGFDDLIKAWQIIHVENSDWILDIYGQGPMEDDLEQLILNLGLESVVHLKAPTKEIESAYFDHSILAMTSRYEGLPMVLLEAQACGLPMVAYACKCGPRDIIQGNNNGLLADEGNINMVAQHLITLMNNEGLRKQMGDNSIKNSAKYKEDLIMRQWLDLFDNLLT